LPIFNPRDITSHEIATTGVHGVGAEYIAKTPDPGQEVNQGALKAIEDSFLWELVRGGTIRYIVEGVVWGALCFPTSYTDKAIKGYIKEEGFRVAHVGRVVSYRDFYYTRLDSAQATADFVLYKNAAGVGIELGVEAVDLVTDAIYLCKLSCSGTTIAAYRTDMATPKISVTDTDFASGGFGWGIHGGELVRADCTLIFDTNLEAPSSPSPRIVAFFEVPIIGDGSVLNPFRADLPRELIRDERTWTPERRRQVEIYSRLGLSLEEINFLFGIETHINTLSVSYSSLIPSDPSSGRPINEVALIRVLESSPEHVKPMRERLDAIRARPGARELTPEQAKRRARELDDKLGDGEAENFINPSEENELDGLADFYERELVRLGRLKPEQLPTLKEDIKRYAEKAKNLGRSRAERRFKRLMS